MFNSLFSKLKRKQTQDQSKQYNPQQTNDDVNLEEVLAAELSAQMAKKQEQAELEDVRFSKYKTYYFAFKNGDYLTLTKDGKSYLLITEGSDVMHEFFRVNQCEAYECIKKELSVILYVIQNLGLDGLCVARYTKMQYYDKTDEAIASIQIGNPLKEHYICGNYFFCLRNNNQANIYITTRSLTAANSTGWRTLTSSRG